MPARILDGKALAKTLREETAAAVTALKQERGISPCLATVLVGDDPASDVYVRNKHKACEKAGIESRDHRLAVDTPQEELMRLIGELNADAAVHGILVQMPLPDHLDAVQVLDAIHPAKDVDAFHPHNVGLMVQGRPRFLPCTPHGIMQLLHRSEITVQGKQVVVLGRSDIVGKPMAAMLMQKKSKLGADAVNATVTVCHSRTVNLPEICRQADILIAAIGKARFVTAELVKPGAVVIDVGINRVGDKLVGDVDFEPVSVVASAITPVPGGVGPLTIAMLLQNTLLAAT